DRPAEDRRQPARRLDREGGGLLGRRVARQRLERRRGVEAGAHAQRLSRERLEHGELLAQMHRGAALGRDVGSQLRGAVGQAPQAGLHAKRRADGGVEIERHRWEKKGHPMGARPRVPLCVRAHTRFLYSCVRVSISTLSPSPTNNGTEISKPVPTRRAGFITLPEVSPLTAGSVWIWRTTVVGSSTEIALPS